MGCGVVGYGVAQMLIENRAQISRAAGTEIYPKYMLDIRDMDVPEGVILTHSFDDILADASVSVVVETIGGIGAAYDFTRRALESGRHVVTSNKELVASCGDKLKDVAARHGAMYFYEASVGGGIPVIQPLHRMLSANRLSRIDGIVNGSTNYLLTRMRENGVSFADALEEARRLGYAEADPSADVEGWDARRKLAILANAAFGSRLADESLIPTVGISGVTETDLTAAKAFSGAVRLIAHAHLADDGASWSGWVHPAFVPAGHPLCSVDDVFNGILVRGNYVDDVLFFGRGAGRKPTASAVVGDLVAVARDINHPHVEYPFDVVPAFVPEDAPMRRLFHTDTVYGEALGRLGWEVRISDRGLAVLTSPVTQTAFDAACAALGIAPDVLYAVA